MNWRTSYSRRLIIWLAAILMLGSAGFISDVTDNYFEISKNLDIFGHLYREVNAIYVEETDPSDLMRVGIDAMLESLDPYTTFISEEEAEEVAFMSTGQYGGIGAVVQKRDQEMIVSSCYKGYPADKGGIKPGDRIIRVNNQRIEGSMSIADLRKLLRGSRGTSVALEVARPGEKNPRPFTLTRDRIKVENVPYFGMVNEEIGFIALAGFTQYASREVQHAYRTLKEEHPKLKGLILDLRGNPGGRLDEAVKVSNLFVPQESLIVETRGRQDADRRRHYAQRIPMDEHIPLALLVNGRSASAAEIVAGSIQDLDRGVIIGQRSFGKGLVQNIRPLSYNTQLKVTTARYYTPSGRCIQALNYGKRDANGKAQAVPDSLRVTFQTASGRSVRDGGGIEPDRVVRQTESQTVVKALTDQGLIFDFATYYVQAHPSIPAPRSFQISHALFEEFVRYTAKEHFTYETDMDEEFATLKETIAAEAYGNALEAELSAIERKIAQMKDQNLPAHQDEIKALLRKEIVARYYYQAGERELGLDQDQEVALAVEILTNPVSYRSILGQN